MAAIAGRGPIQMAPVGAAAALFALVLYAAAQEGGVRQVAAALIGLLCGATLYHAAFGFTGGWRRLVRERRGEGFRAQLLLIGLVAIVSFPLIAYGPEAGLRVGGWVFPVGLSSAIGAALFGFGMQLGGGCGSGVLFTAGGGSTRMFVTLFFFILGSVIWAGTNADFQAGLTAAAQAVGFEAAPRMGGFSMIREWGAPAALVACLGLLALLWALSRAVELRAHGALERQAPAGSWLRGPWTRTQGAVLLAIASILTFLALGRPWGITSAYAPWGGQIGEALGAPMREWGVISSAALDASPFANATGVMNFGLMLGAFGAAGLAGRFAPVWRLSARDLATAVVGGLLMGYGARLAYGCNIGGFVGGVVSGSLHGWWWLIFGWLGSWVGVYARAAIGMDPPMRAPRAGA